MVKRGRPKAQKRGHKRPKEDRHGKTQVGAWVKEEVYQEAKIQAILEHKTTGGLIENAIEFYLANKRSDSPQTSGVQIKESETVREVVSIKSILQKIYDLDKKHKSQNYLPIFHYREALPDFDRDFQDSILFELVRRHLIRLSALQEGRDYNSEQFDMGIENPGSGPLFFIVILSKGARLLKS